jgi:hypothetical protein
MNNTITWKQTAVDKYESTNGEVIKREYGKTPNGNNLNGFWVYRNANGEFIDYDQYRHDLFERHRLNILSELDLPF